MEIKVNVGSQIKMLRNNTFADPLSFIDENIQNGQRAKSTKIIIDYDSKKNTMKFFDDGCGLTDPQSLLHIASSGWEDKSESPFGQGFFNNIAVAEEIYVQSNTFSVAMDVNKMMTGDLDVDVTNISQTDGFEVLLVKLNDLDELKVKERVFSIAQYLPQEVVYNNEACPKKDFTIIPEDEKQFGKQIDTEKYKGWVSFKEGYGHKVALLYCGRKVCDFNWYHVSGEIHMVDGSLLDLRAPDRKDIVSNDKLNIFKRELKSIFGELALDIIERDEDYSKIDDAMVDFTNFEKASDIIKFLVYSSGKQDDLKELTAMALGDLDREDKINRQNTIVDQGNNIEGNIVSDTVDRKVSLTDSYRSSGSYGSDYSRNTRDTSKDSEEYCHINKGRTAYYVRKKDTSSLYESINYCKDYDIDVVVCKNSFQVRMCEYLARKGYNITELKKLSATLDYDVVLNQCEKGMKQVRAERIIKTVFSAIGLDNDVYVGSVEVLKKLSEQSVKVDVGMIYVRDVFYINDEIIEIDSLSTNTSNKWTKSDAKFILNNMSVITECLVKADLHKEVLKGRKEIVVTDLICMVVAGLL